MIRLSKLSAEDAAHGGAIAWLAQRRVAYRRAREAGEPTKHFLPMYREDRVKAAIMAETFGKCAYCESKYVTVTWGDVEHILPRAADPERQLDYENLTLACSICNNAKSDKEYADGMGLVNPYSDLPEQYLTVSDHLLRPALKAAAFVRGKRTIDDVKLNRPGLLEARRRFVDRCFEAMFEHENAPNQPLKDYAREKIDDMQAPAAEYSAVARQVFRAYGF
ncbi:MAG TPA: HNH endonuclease signature motif containing protein [Candidatus Elarobacter sp.]